MGYTTDFTGKLDFKGDITAAKLREVNEYIGESQGFDGHLVDLELTDDFRGIQWDGSEKTYCMLETIQDLARKCNILFEGEIIAQGQDHEDRWIITTSADGAVHRKDYPRLCERITCPYCKNTFTLEGPAETQG